MVYALLSLLTYLVVAVIPAKNMAHLSYTYRIFVALSLVVMLVLFRLNRQPVNSYNKR